MKYIPLLLSLAGVLNATMYTVATSVTCEITTSHEVVHSRPSYGTDGCRAEAMDGSFAEAVADVFVHAGPTEAGLNLSVQVAGGGTVYLADMDPDIEVALLLHEKIRAVASAEVTLFLTTGGPVRPGVLQAEHWVDDHEPEPRGRGIWYSYPLPSEFKLGTPFEMSLSVSSGASLWAADLEGRAPIEDRLTGGASDQSFRFPRVYEADGITPVQLYWADEAPASTPEPSTYALAGIGLVGLLISRLRKFCAERDGSLVSNCGTRQHSDAVVAVDARRI